MAAFSSTQRTNARTALTNAGYDSNLVNTMEDDELQNLLKTIGSDVYQRGQRTQDRTESLADFRSQLADLTSSKQRQAEQAGRIAQANTRQQGLSQMMSNF